MTHSLRDTDVIGTYHAVIHTIIGGTSVVFDAEVDAYDPMSRKAEPSCYVELKTVGQKVWEGKKTSVI